MIRSCIRCAAIAAGVLLGASRAGAQVEIKAGDDVNFKLGILGQFQADTIGDPATDTNTENLYVRRLRLMFGGQVAKGVTFFVETDSPNLGKVLPAGTNIPSTIIVQDAYAEFAAGKAFAIDAGLMFIPFSRNSLQSAATLVVQARTLELYRQIGLADAVVARGLEMTTINVWNTGQYVARVVPWAARA